MKQTSMCCETLTTTDSANLHYEVGISIACFLYGSQSVGKCLIACLEAIVVINVIYIE